MPVLNTENLGTLVASAKNGKKYKIFLIDASAGITADALKKNPDFDSAAVIYSNDVDDAGGTGEADLGPMKNDIETKTNGLKTSAQLASFVVGWGEEEGDIAAAAGPVFTLPQPGVTVSPNSDHVDVGAKVTVKLEFSKLDEVKLSLLPAGAGVLSAPKLTEAGEFTIEGKLNGKAQIVAVGARGGADAVTKKVDIDVVGPSVKIEKFSYAP